MSKLVKKEKNLKNPTADGDVLVDDNVIALIAFLPTFAMALIVVFSLFPLV